MKTLKPYLYGKERGTDHECYYKFVLDRANQYVERMDVRNVSAVGPTPEHVLVKFTVSEKISGSEVDRFPMDGSVLINSSLRGSSDIIIFTVSDSSGGSTGGSSTAHYADFD